MGRSTTARLVNLPQSRAWAAHVQTTGLLPPEVAEGEHLLLMASAHRWSTVAPKLVTVQTLNKSFRSRCVAPFFSAADQKAHRAAHRNKLTPTFGFEAVVHALYACDSVEVGGSLFTPSTVLPNALSHFHPPSGLGVVLQHNPLSVASTA